MAVVNSTAAQLIALRVAIRNAEDRVQNIIERGDTAAGRNAAQLALDDAAVTALKSATDAVAAA